MIQTTHRPFTDAEREEVESQLLDCVNEAVSDRKAAFGVGLLGTCAGAVLGTVVAYLLKPLCLPILFLVATGAIMAGGINRKTNNG